MADHDGMPMGGDADACPAVHFLVPLFTQPSSVNGTTTTSSYHTASDEAHTLLGILLLCMVAAWAAFVMDFVRIKWAARLAALFHTTMGLYLFSWVFYFMHPDVDRIFELWAYSTRDLLQLQHIAIASLLTAGGLIELLQSFALLPPMTTLRLLPSDGSAPSTATSLAALNALRSGSYWHSLWCINLVLTGLVFMLHPQHTYGATVKHLVLGCALVLGAPLCIRAKSVAWQQDLDHVRRAAAAHAQAQVQARNSRIVSPRASPELTLSPSSPPRNNSRPTTVIANHIDWSMIAAGGCFTIAACILLAFREKESPAHIGTERTCQPAFVVCALAYTSAGMSGSAAIAVAWWQHRRIRAIQRGTASTTPVRRRFLASLLKRWRRTLGWTALAAGQADEDNDDETEYDEERAGNSAAAAARRRRGDDDHDDGDIALAQLDSPDSATAQYRTQAHAKANGHAHANAATVAAGLSNGTHANSDAAPLHRTASPSPFPPSRLDAAAIAAAAENAAHQLGELDDYADGEEEDAHPISSHAHEDDDEEALRELERDRRRREEYTGDDEDDAPGTLP